MPHPTTGDLRRLADALECTGEASLRRATFLAAIDEIDGKGFSSARWAGGKLTVIIGERHLRAGKREKWAPEIVVERQGVEVAVLAEHLCVDAATTVDEAATLLEKTPHAPGGAEAHSRLCLDTHTGAMLLRRAAVFEEMAGAWRRGVVTIWTAGPRLCVAAPGVTHVTIHAVPNSAGYYHGACRAANARCEYGGTVEAIDARHNCPGERQQPLHPLVRAMRRIIETALRDALAELPGSVSAVDEAPTDDEEAHRRSLPHPLRLPHQHLAMGRQ